MAIHVLEAYYVELEQTDIYETQEELLAYVFEHYLTNELNKSIDPYQLKTCFNAFINYVESRHENVNINNVFNSTIYNWYFGNCLTYLYTLLLQPELYVTRSPAFSYEFVQGIVDIVYRLVSQYDCSIHCIDYHELTILDYVTRFSQEHAEKIKIHIDHFLSLYYLAKFGKAATQVQRKKRF
jgi:hypothetical protein